MRAFIGRAESPFHATWTSGLSRRFTNHAGLRSSPPFEATMTMVEPSCSGDVSITVCGRPVLRPVVVSCSTGIFPAAHPMRPPENFTAAWCKVLRTLNVVSFCTGATLARRRIRDPGQPVLAVREENGGGDQHDEHPLEYHRPMLECIPGACIS